MNGISLLAIALTLLSPTAQALQWQDLWQTKDQQAKTLLNQGKYNQAQTLFEQPDWRATAAYRAGNYEQAAKQFQSFKSEQGYYNEGNALAKLGRYEAAIKAYDKTLALNPAHEDATFNKKLLEELLKNQEKNQQNKQDDQKKDQDQQDKKSEPQQQGQDQKDQNQKPKDQQGQPQDQDKQKEQNEKQEQKDAQAKEEPSQSKEQQTEAAKQTPEQREKQQAKEQWLQLIPDDPGGLLRQKFLRDHLRRQKEFSS